jgi:predicted PurR-regulated permease PerM
MTTLSIILIVSLVIVLVLGFVIVTNLLRQVEGLEDIVTDQVGYLRKVSYLIKDSKEHIEKLDSSGHFQVDDELGVFFNYMKQIQETADSYQLPENYGEKEE